jgi:hypothetical protein
LVDLFLNICGAIIDCKKEKILTKFGGESYEFNFSKFLKVLIKLNCLIIFFRVEQLTFIVLGPNNDLQQYIEDQEDA